MPRNRPGRPDALRKDQHFALIPEWVLYHDDLSPQAVRLYCVLSRYADHTGACWPSRRTLGERLGRGGRPNGRKVASRKTVDRALEQLEAVGAVTVSARYTDNGDQDSNLFTVHTIDPSHVGSDLTPPPAESDPGGGDTDVPTGGAKSDATGGAKSGPQTKATRNHAAAAADAHATTKHPTVAELPPAIEILRSKLQAYTALQRLRFDQLRPDHVEQLLELLEIHGDRRLVQIALDSYRAPGPVYVQGYIPTWQACPVPGQTLREVGSTDDERCPKPGHASYLADHCGFCATDRLVAGGDA